MSNVCVYFCPVEIVASEHDQCTNADTYQSARKSSWGTRNNIFGWRTAVSYQLDYM